MKRLPGRFPHSQRPFLIGRATTHATNLGSYLSAEEASAVILRGVERLQILLVPKKADDAIIAPARDA